MAKVTGPLLSFDARGKLGGAMVFSAWKGVGLVRQYVVPANPRTSAQVTQRTKFAQVVDRWHDLSGDDRDAWNRAASLASSPMSGFNAHTKNDLALLAEDPNNYEAANVQVTAGTGQISIAAGLIKITDGTADDGSNQVAVAYGTSPNKTTTAFMLSYNSSSGKYEGSISGLTAGVKYYLRIAQHDGMGNLGSVKSGIFTATPT